MYSQSKETSFVQYSYQSVQFWRKIKILENFYKKIPQGILEVLFCYSVGCFIYFFVISAIDCSSVLQAYPQELHLRLLQTALIPSLCLLFVTKIWLEPHSGQRITHSLLLDLLSKMMPFLVFSVLEETIKDPQDKVDQHLFCSRWLVTHCYTSYLMFSSQ